MDLGIWIILSALAGAKLLLLIVDFKQFTGSAQAFLGLLQSGGVFYGGLIAAILVAIWYMRRYRMPLWTTTDVFAPGDRARARRRPPRLPDGRLLFRTPGVGAVGDYLHRSLVRRGERPLLGVPLHPTQLYEAATEAVILAVLLVTERLGRPFPGRTFWTYMLLYGTSRFVIEFYRGDARGMVFDALSTSQFVLDRDRPAGDRHARPSRPQRRSHAPRCGPARGRMSTPVPEEATRRRIDVPLEQDGARLDAFLTSALPDRSRSQVQKLIKDGHVTGPGEGDPREHARQGRADVRDRAPRPRGGDRRRRRPAAAHPVRRRRPRRHRQAGRHGRAPGADHAAARS
jgi:phosphatidylglycerol:prolipoprotein diacylglycerol transferase